jgi:hypothetical protein
MPVPGLLLFFPERRDEQDEAEDDYRSHEDEYPCNHGVKLYPPLIAVSS